jgi:inner membrane protein
VVEQRDGNTFTIHPVSLPDELYQVSSRSDMGHQIVSERITGKVGRKVLTSIESITWVDEEILPRLEEMRARFPNGMMYLTGSIEIDDSEQISIQAKPQQLATVNKQGRKLEFNSCPLGDAIGLLGEQWGSGQVRVRIVIEN